MSTRQAIQCTMNSNGTEFEEEQVVHTLNIVPEQLTERVLFSKSQLFTLPQWI